MKIYFYSGKIKDATESSYNISGLAVANNAIEAWELMQDSADKNKSIKHPAQIHLTKFEVVE